MIYIVVMVVVVGVGFWRAGKSTTGGMTQPAKPVHVRVGQKASRIFSWEARKLGSWLPRN